MYKIEFVANRGYIVVDHYEETKSGQSYNVYIGKCDCYKNSCNCVSRFVYPLSMVKSITKLSGKLPSGYIIQERHSRQDFMVIKIKQDNIREFEEWLKTTYISSNIGYCEFNIHERLALYISCGTRTSREEIIEYWTNQGYELIVND